MSKDEMVLWIAALDTAASEIGDRRGRRFIKEWWSEVYGRYLGTFDYRVDPPF